MEAREDTSSLMMLNVSSFLLKIFPKSELKLGETKLLTVKTIHSGLNHKWIEK